MRILIVGAGNMGSWLVEALCLEHELGVYDSDKKKLRFFFHCHRFVQLNEILSFKPEMVINAVSLQHTITVYNEILPFIPETCILADIASVKSGLKEYYEKINRRFVSSHPMFGPTFANIKDLSNQNAIIIKEGDAEGKNFFYDFYSSIHINIYEYSFEQHDKTIAYSLSIPFVTTLLFASAIKKQEAPGTTFKKHMNIAKGLMTENNYLLSEVLFSPYTLKQIEKMGKKLQWLYEIIQNKETDKLHLFFDEIRKNIE